MNNVYLDLKNRHQEEVNSFPMFFAFNQKQFEEAMASLGLTPKDTDKVYGFGKTGGIYRKSDAAALREMFDRQEKEREQAIAADTTGEGYIFDMFDYELANHEYCITWDVSDALRALGLTIEDVQANPLLAKGLDAARKAQFEDEGE